ncbi:MAG: hypothetical protein JWQ27_1510 [Ferruginibacter sp.]|nr:hypothetical protein [Ferruginibacter sp.]
MEDETRDFFVRIINSIAMSLIWMISQVLVGIYWGYGFFSGSPTWQNLLYYVFFVITLLLLIRYLRKKWTVNT